MADFMTCTSLTDAGPFVTRLLLSMPEEVAAGAAGPETFSVFVQRRNRTTGELIALNRKSVSPEVLADTADGLSQGYWPVRAVCPWGEDGQPASRSRLLALEMPYGPAEHLSALAAQAHGPYNDFVDMIIRVTQVAPIPGSPGCMGLVFDHCAGDLRPELAGWSFSDQVSASRPLRFGWFRPGLREGEKKPLLVWLHGAGGGGKDPRYPVQGNRVTGFSSPRGQKALGGAWVLAPQCPTLWMDDGKGSPLMRSNDSIYVERVKALVDTFVAEHEAEIDRDQIFIAGNSNGGFMAVKQAMAYPDFYAAAVPVCEAVVADLVTEKELSALKNVPIWFVHSRYDFVVDPEKTVLPLYGRLKKAGAREVHLTLLGDITDESGAFRRPDGTPYTYIPHFAWVPVYNNACRTDADGSPVVKDGFQVGIFEWLRRTRLSQRKGGKSNAESDPV